MDTALANLVFSHLGVPSVSATTDNVEHMRRLLGVADVVRRKVIGEGNWPFATKRVTLASEVATPDFGWDYSFVLPGDFIRLISLPDVLGNMYTVEGDRLLLNDDEVDLVYVADIDGSLSHLWTNEFRHALAFAYAATIAMSATGSSTLRSELWQQYSSALTRALATADKSGRPLTWTVNTLVDASHGYSTSSQYP